MSETSGSPSRRIGDLALAGLVHDLNNVFSAISEASEVLSCDPRWQRLAGALERSADCGRRIVDDFVSGALAALELDVVLARASAHVLDLLPLLGAPPIEFKLRLEPGIRLRGMASDWERVFMNLFLNAAQAMKEGGAVLVEARLVGNLVEMIVTDNGPGIPAPLLPQIFEPHFSTKSPQRGLGLHIVSSIVAQYGGSVSAANSPGPGGACFSIRVPAAVAASA
jgi:signal transduction histidine kinase